MSLFFGISEVSTGHGLPGTDPEHRRICSGDLYPLVAPRRPDEPDLKDAGWQPPRLGNRIRNCLGVGPRRQEQRCAAVRVYRNCLKPTPPLEPREEAESFIRQWDSLQEFFAHWERNSEGDLAGTFNNYRNLEEFEELFREHFRDFLAHH